MQEILDLLKWSPPLILVLALLVLGKAIKTITAVPNWTIPFILPIVGAIVYCLIGGAVPLQYIDKVQYRECTR